MGPQRLHRLVFEVVGWETVPERADARYPQIELDAALRRSVDLVLLSSQPFMFREKDLAEFRAMPELAGRRIALIDGEMTSWYGSRAIEGIAARRRMRTAIEASACNAPNPS